MNKLEKMVTIAAFILAVGGAGLTCYGMFKSKPNLMIYGLVPIATGVSVIKHYDNKFKNPRCGV